jgi:hypothetical protein
MVWHCLSFDYLFFVPFPELGDDLTLGYQELRHPFHHNHENGGDQVPQEETNHRADSRCHNP